MLMCINKFHSICMWDAKFHKYICTWKSVKQTAVYVDITFIKIVGYPTLFTSLMVLLSTFSLKEPLGSGSSKSQKFFLHGLKNSITLDHALPFINLYYQNKNVSLEKFYVYQLIHKICETFPPRVICNIPYVDFLPSVHMFLQDLILLIKTIHMSQCSIFTVWVGFNNTT